MAGRLSFSIAINLLTENFKSGASSVKQSLKSMQMQVLTFVAALGAGGIGLTDFVSRLISTARETGRVTTALKNVSGSAIQYVENQRFLLSMAKKYGSEVNALTNAYAKFTAAASTAGMAVSDQQKIFESVSRATTAFGLSADDSNGVFLALSQMMSKGKISAEELRGQMGERLPIAFQAMAKAAGTSVAGLDKLMKAGSVMSAEVLPKFADALNSMIPNVNTDNAETSVNRLQNAFTSFTKGTGVQSAFKSLIDNLTSIVSYAGENIKSIVSSVVAFIIGTSLGKLFKWIAIELAKAQRAALIAASKAAKAAGQSFDAAAWKAQSGAATISAAFTRAGAAIKAAFISVLPTAIFIGIAELISHLRNVYEETKRIKGIFSEYLNESKKAGNTEEIAKLRELQAVINNRKSSQIEINSAQSELESMLGVEKKSQKELNGLVGKRIQLLEQAAKADFYAKSKVENESKSQDIINKAAGIGISEKNFKRIANIYPLSSSTDKNQEYYRKVVTQALPNDSWASLGSVNRLVGEYVQNQRVITDASLKLKDAVLKSATTNTINTVDNKDEKHKETDLEKAQSSYAEKLRELDAELSIGKISQQEYNKSFDELNQSALVEALAMNDTSKAHSDYVSALKKKVAAPQYNATQDEFDKIQTDYNKSLKELAGQRNAGAITEQEYSDKTKDLIESTMGLTASLLGADAKATEFYNNLLIKRAEIKNPSLKTRDTTYDYKKSKTDIASENLDVAKQNLETIKNEYNKSAEDFTEKLNAAMDNVTTLEDALKIATVKQDIEDLSNEINKGIYSGVKDVASSADRMVSSFQNIRDVFSNVDSSGWERIMAVWNALVNTVDGFLSILDMINNLTKLTEELSKAKKKEQRIEDEIAQKKLTNAGAEIGANAAIVASEGGKIAITKIGEEVDKEATETKVQNAATGAAADTLAAAVKVSTTATGAAADTLAAGVKVTTATTEVGANTAVAASEAAKSAAKIPFPFNILAMGAAIGSTLSLLSSIPKFETGGIVGGNSFTGDKILTRLNSGEMVLNKSQQNIVGSAISRNAGTNITIGGQVRGADLYLTMKNYMKQTGKKL